MYEWDDAKDDKNILRHGLGFETAIRIFDGPVLRAADNRFDMARSAKTASVWWAACCASSSPTPTVAVSFASFQRGGQTASKGSVMPKQFDRELNLDELTRLNDDEIDTTDIPELDDNFWLNAKLVAPEGTEQVTLRVKKSVLKAYRETGKGYQTRMNAVLESYARTLKS